MANRTAPHAKLVAQIRKRLGREPDLTLYLNTKGRLKNIGGQHAYVAEPALTTGSSDLVGMFSLPLPHFVRSFATWFCLEVKTGEAVLTPEQELFRGLVLRRGGFFAVVRSEDDAVSALTRAREGKQE